MPTIALVQIDLDDHHLVVKDFETQEVYWDEEILLPESFRLEVGMNQKGMLTVLVENEW